MTTKITLILVALLLVPACINKKAASKPKDAGPTALAASGDEAAKEAARNAPDAGEDAKPGEAVDAGVGPDARVGRGPDGRIGGYITDDGGVAKQPLFTKFPDVPKTLVITISMGAQDYDVMINPETTAWRIPMNAKPNELLSIAQRARAAPDARDGQVTVFLGNSVEPAVGQSMMEALRTAGFKVVKMELPRRP